MRSEDPTDAHKTVSRNRTRRHTSTVGLGGAGQCEAIKINDCSRVKTRLKVYIENPSILKTQSRLHLIDIIKEAFYRIRALEKQLEEKGKTP